MPGAGTRGGGVRKSGTLPRSGLTASSGARSSARVALAARASHPWWYGRPRGSVKSRTACSVSHTGDRANRIAVRSSLRARNVVMMATKIRACANLFPGGPSAATVGDVLRRRSPAADRATYGAALASREFRAVFAAAGLSVTGNVVADIVQTVLIYDRTHSPLLSSLSFALGFLPFLVTGTLLSSLVDRVPPRRLLVRRLRWPPRP